MIPTKGILMNTSNNNITEFIVDRLREFWSWVRTHLRIVIPVAILIVLIIVTAIGNAAQSRKEAEEAKKASESVETESVTASLAITIPNVPLKENAYKDVNALFDSYYSAMAAGKIAEVRKLNNNVDDTEQIRITETAKYIDKYDKIDVYTKPGPVSGTYLAYVYSMVKFKKYDNEVPGMQAYYVCTDKNGKLYIEENEQDESVLNYIREVSLQDDVVDLNNKVAVSYNNMIAKDSNLSKFLLQLTNDIDVSVGETLAQAGSTEASGSTAAGSTEAASGSTEAAQSTSAAASESTKETTADSSKKTAVAAGTKVETIDVVNVRSSDSETADKVGKAQPGEVYELKQEKENGWSEIDYNGTDAYIKTQYLKKVSSDTAADSKASSDKTADTAAKTAAKTDTSSSSSKSNGTVTVKETVRIRSSANTDAEKLGSAFKGDKLEVIMKQADGWTKVKYNGKTGYVKSEYVE
jgi:uncharacterized protein YgiM (DUF1202 family)